MGPTNAISCLFCKVRIVLLLVMGVMLLGLAAIYFVDSLHYGPRYKTSVENLIKCLPPDKKDEDKNQERSSSVVEMTTQMSDVKVCPALSPYLKGVVPLSFEPSLNLEKVTSKNPEVENGRFRPKNCEPQQKVAILIPHRNRERHLLYLLENLHPFLQRQQLDYGIYVIHQAGNMKFNRAKLLNVGYLEALKEEKWDCFVFHDVDLLPENDFNLYLCDSEPKHLVVGRNATGYRLRYPGYFGGVTAMTRGQFAKVNGYSNNYWGWGGEDDDLRYRVELQNMKVVRPAPQVAKYTMIFHTRDSGNEVNGQRMQLLNKVSKVWKADGLNSCSYRALSVEHNPMYINITADIGGPR
ncbi:beta-1,4-galactosyltransferase 4 [Spea bombifrons]|uniref:beta-1,4-galactosyltransferase 4 n=1 Tax=Spea bombifrons TaxID=233779 RepID=UPI0023494EA3|nr:beta-1,4-galactosyltransferase 4 [Spea bombifrons]